MLTIRKENNMLNFNDIVTGEIFTIGNTPSYPKLKTDYGYIDIRDEIKKTGDCKFPVRLMTDEEIIAFFNVANRQEAKDSVAFLLAQG